MLFEMEGQPLEDNAWFALVSASEQVLRESFDDPFNKEAFDNTRTDTVAFVTGDEYIDDPITDLPRGASHFGGGPGGAPGSSGSGGSSSGSIGVPI